MSPLREVDTRIGLGDNCTIQLTDYSGLHAAWDKIRIPQPGDSNPRVRIGVANVKTGFDNLLGLIALVSRDGANKIVILIAVSFTGARAQQRDMAAQAGAQLDSGVRRRLPNSPGQPH